MFDRRLPAVVPMDHRYLAKFDGSEMASGRGSGVQPDATKLPAKTRPGRQAELAGRKPDKTPYMHMTFGPLERRLDTAIWRALFASSAKQARQFVVHGWVKVNGKKMIYPGYQLNPGDMFQVEPERVMYATGARKRKTKWASSYQHMRAWEKEEDAKHDAESAKKPELDKGDRENDGESEAGAATLESDEEREAMSTKPEDEKDARKALKNLVIRAKRILEDSKRKLSGKRQQELRAFTQSLRKTMSKHRPGEEGAQSAAESVEDFEAALAEIMTKIPQDIVAREPLPDAAAAAAQAEARTNTDSTAAITSPNAQDPTKQDKYRADKDAKLLAAALERARANPVDRSKPYATPWIPRDYMSAFAFIPRYLEVNQNICSAVYLRHPVARPGLAEVPTPFHGETMGLAFNWYLRRR